MVLKWLYLELTEVILTHIYWPKQVIWLQLTSKGRELESSPVSGRTGEMEILMSSSNI